MQGLDPEAAVAGQLWKGVSLPAAQRCLGRAKVARFSVHQAFASPRHCLAQKEGWEKGRIYSVSGAAPLLEVIARGPSSLVSDLSVLSQKQVVLRKPIRELWGCLSSSCFSLSMCFHSLVPPFPWSVHIAEPARVGHSSHLTLRLPCHQGQGKSATYMGH